MKYDDLLNCPYKSGGRNKEEGFDCYGLVIEMCKRNETPLKDLTAVKTLPEYLLNDYIKKVNVKQCGNPKKGRIIETSLKGHLHLGFLVENNLVIHSTKDYGVRLTPLVVFKNVKIFEVINESCDL